MEKNHNAQVVGKAPATHFDGAGVDTRAEFEAWLDRLRPRQPIGLRQQSPLIDKADFFVSCTEGSGCLISFEGVLHLEGFISGNIQSENGTLVTGGGLIDGNIDVVAAFIDGSVIGNIRAAERVVLYAEAKVAGNIISPVLSTKPGSLFEGDCVLLETIDPRPVPLSSEMTSEFADF